MVTIILGLYILSHDVHYTAAKTPIYVSPEKELRGLNSNSQDRTTYFPAAE
jgi:hypothetical protein